MVTSFLDYVWKIGEDFSLYLCKCSSEYGHVFEKEHTNTLIFCQSEYSGLWGLTNWSHVRRDKSPPILSKTSTSLEQL